MILAGDNEQASLQAREPKRTSSYDNGMKLIAIYQETKHQQNSGTTTKS